MEKIMRNKESKDMGVEELKNLEKDNDVLQLE